MEKIFKAKRLDNGDWFYSISLDFLDSDDYVLMGKKDAIYGVVWNKCDKDTICQYTGRNDKEGNRIFEGDEFTDCSFVRMQQGCWVADYGDDIYCLYEVDEDLELTGHNIHDTKNNEVIKRR